ncbi:MAG: helix-turn-helix domain-containing protein [Anaerolineae bacterium]|nr:helix-turn-helix domain-containing protein [Anaerolineae bacterium]
MAARYTEDQRQQVLEMLRSNRFDVAHIARELGISRQTIYNWIDESGDENLLKMPNVSNMSRLASQVEESQPPEPDYIDNAAYRQELLTQISQLLHLVKLLLPGIESQVKTASFKDQITTLIALTDVRLKINRFLSREPEADPYYA